MQTMVTASEVGAHIFQIMDEISETHQPVIITGTHNNAVIMSEQDFRSMQETIYLSSIPNMVQSIVEGMNTPLADCRSVDDIEW